MAFTPDGVWVAVAPDRDRTGRPGGLERDARQSVGSGPTAVLPAFGSIWVANHFDGTVSRLEPSTGRVTATIQVGGRPERARGPRRAPSGSPNENGDSITAIDPGTDRVERTLVVGGATASLAAEGDGLWLAVGASATEHRGGTLIVSAQEEVFSSLDPAVVYGFPGWQILSFTNDGLLAYKRVGGPDGATLVPDLASTFPQVSPDGLTYRFPLREGIRTRPESRSDRRTSDTAWSAAFSLSPDGGVAVPRLDGADACAEDPSTCDLSGSIEDRREAR